MLNKYLINYHKDTKIIATQIDYLASLYTPPLEHYTAEPTTQTQASPTNRYKHINQWLVTHIVTKNSLGILHKDFKCGTI